MPAIETNYLSQVGKADILQAVTKAVSPQAAYNIAAMKKPDMAQAAERLMADRGWLPPVLCLIATPETLPA